MEFEFCTISFEQSIIDTLGTNVIPILDTKSVFSIIFQLYHIIGDEHYIWCPGLIKPSFFVVYTCQTCLPSHY